MKKSLVALALASAFVFTANNANATGIPVVDAALATIQQQNQIESIDQMIKQYQQLVQQYNQAVSLYSNFTGSRGLGTINYSSALRSLLPADQVNQMTSVADKGLSALSSAGKAIYDKFNLGSSCEKLTNDTDKENCQKEQALFAELQASRQTTQSNIKERLTNIESMMVQIDSATDSKAIADLQARLSAEVSAFNASVAEANQGLEQQKELFQQQKENEARQQSIANFSALSDSEIGSMLKFK